MLSEALVRIHHAVTNHPATVSNSGRFRFVLHFRADLVLIRFSEWLSSSSPAVEHEGEKGPAKRPDWPTRLPKTIGPGPHASNYTPCSISVQPTIAKNERFSDIANDKNMIAGYFCPVIWRLAIDEDFASEQGLKLNVRSHHHAFPHICIKVVHNDRISNGANRHAISTTTSPFSRPDRPSNQQLMQPHSEAAWLFREITLFLVRLFVSISEKRPKRRVKANTTHCDQNTTYDIILTSKRYTISNDRNRAANDMRIWPFTSGQ